MKNNMIIFEKPDVGGKIKASSIKPVSNHVLIKPDPDYETYQRKGVDVGISTVNHAYENGKMVDVSSRHLSVTGTVVATPSNLIYNGKKIYDSRFESDFQYAEKFYNLRKDSLMFDAEMELEVGDRVRFSYTAHLDAVQAGRIIDTDEGQMMFMRYDKLFMVVNEDLSPKRMVNGYILVKGIEDEVSKETGMEYVTSDSGLVMPLIKKTKERRSRKIMEAEVVCAGSNIKGSTMLPEAFYPEIHLEKGQTILMDPRGSKRLEPLNHQHHEDNLYLLHSRSVIFVSEKSDNFVFDVREIQYE